MDFYNGKNGEQITYSCDVVFYEIGKGFFYSDHPDGMQETFRKWGLGTKAGIDLPGEATGRVPDAQWKASYYASSSEDDRSWKGGDYTNLAIGQGDLLVTPLQMCCVYAGISTKGTIWRPHLLKSVDVAVGLGSVIDHKDTLTYQRCALPRGCRYFPCMAPSGKRGLPKSPIMMSS